jgi:predicted CxxxxCH...CXXCH cytochrome family protein
MKPDRRTVAVAMLLPTLLLALPLLLLPGTASADHGGGQDCYICHDLSYQYFEAGTKYLNKASMSELKNAGWTAGKPVGCVYCHRSLHAPYITNVLDSFRGTPYPGSSRHPVSRNYVTGSYDNNVFWSGDNSANASHLDCIDCHDPSMTRVPNHDNAFLVSLTNPYGLRSVAANKQYDTFCLLCHGKGKVSFPSGKSIGKSIEVVSHDNAVDNVANAIRDIDNTHLRAQDNTATGYRCSVCHDAHDSGNLHLFSDGTERNASGLKKTAIDEKGDCTTVCHYRGDAAGNYDLHGHGKATDWQGITLGQNCTFCHDSNVPHNMKNYAVDNNYMRKYRFSSLDPGWLTPSVFGKPQKSVCGRCHSDKVVHNIQSGGAVGCLDCHDQHAKGSENNVMMIPAYNQVAGSMIGVTGVGSTPGSEPVLFTKSFRYSSGDNQFHFWTNTSFKGDATPGFCDQRACHGAGDKLGFPYIPLLTYLSTTGEHSGGVYLSNDYNSNCSSCHAHNDAAGSFRASAGCTKCHGYPPPSAYINPDNSSDVYPYNEVGGLHTIHSGPTSAGNYSFPCTYCHVRYTDGATHNNAYPHTFQSVFFYDNVKLGVAAYDNATFRCTNLYCHSNGLGGAPKDNAFWRGAGGYLPPPTIGCDGCHPSTMTSGLHTTHKNAGFGCGTCHTSTSNDNGTALAEGTGVQVHVDGKPTITFKSSYVVDGSPAGHYETSGSNDNTCSGVTCHGGADVVWAPGTLSCDSCHTWQGGSPVAANVYDYVYEAGSGTMSKVSPSFFSGRGHGAAAALPWPGGTNPGGRNCLTCHNPAISHDNGANPFRFRTPVNAKVVNPDNVNSLCAACHTFAGRSEEHATGVTAGGQLAWGHDQNCVDCHDVHGQANIFMVYDNLAWATDNTTYRNSYDNGVPRYPAFRVPVTFLENSLGSSYASVDNGAPYTGICEACHRRTWQFQNSAANGKSGPGPHPVRACLECHAHKYGFRGIGGSNQEQFFDNLSASGNYADRSRHPEKLVLPLTYAGQKNCLACHGRNALDNVTSNGNECLTCHFEFRTGGASFHPNGKFELALPSAPATWWNTGTSYDNVPDTFCLLCHGPGSSGASLNGTAPDNVIPSGESWTGGSGHGATAALSNDALVGPAAYSCRDCHYSSVSTGTTGRDNTAPTYHASLNRKLVGNTDASIHEYPHPADTDTRYDNASKRSRQMDWFCGTRCHGNTTNGDARDDGVVRHTWDNLAGGVKSGGQTHPSDMAPVPGGRFKNPVNLPLSEYVTGALPGTGYEVCVTCHNPHGGAAGLVKDVSTPITGGDKQMMRRSFSDNASTVCKECHL